MKILLIHNTYQQPGGEDVAVRQEKTLLERHGHDVRYLEFDNRNVKGVFQKIKAGSQVANNPQALKRIAFEIRESRPDVVHFHNIFPLVTPAALRMVAEANIPVIQTLHNFRVICAGGLLMRKAQPCEACLGKRRWPAVRFKCYRNSAIGSASTAYMGVAFRKIVLRHSKLITLIALTDFAKSRFLADGYKSDQIVVRPNFTPDVGVGGLSRSSHFLFVGRLSPEKGVLTLLAAFSRSNANLVIIGDGPQYDYLRSEAPSNVTFLGRLSTEAVISEMRRAKALLFPSTWYEGFPMTALEAMATGTPIIASRIGSLNEIVEHGLTGVLLPPGDTDAWTDAINSDKISTVFLDGLGRNARVRYEEHYSETPAYKSIMHIYNTKLGRTPLMDL